MPAVKFQPLTVMIPPEMRADLARMAERRLTSISAIVRELVLTAVAREQREEAHADAR